jgi:hypothetical protein
VADKSRNDRDAAGFDPDFSPFDGVNREAAAAHGLRSDPRQNLYVDEDGCPVRDRFGQAL